MRNPYYNNIISLYNVTCLGIDYCYGFYSNVPKELKNAFEPHKMITFNITYLNKRSTIEVASIAAVIKYACFRP